MSFLLIIQFWFAITELNNSKQMQKSENKEQINYIISM